MEPGLRRQVLESLRELLELVLVPELDHDLIRADARLEAGRPARRPRGPGRPERDRPALFLRGLRFAPASWAARSAATADRPSSTIRLRASSGHRDREQRAPRGRALGQLAAGEHPEHVVRELEQAEAVREGWTRASPRARRRSPRREPELVEQHARRRALLRRRRAARARRSRRATRGASRGRRPSRIEARAAWGSPASLAARQRRSPAISSQPPRSGAGRRRGWSRPCAPNRRRRARSPPRARNAGAAGAGSGGSGRRGARRAPGRLRGRRSGPRGLCPRPLAWD